jgi:hypothetical protein
VVITENFKLDAAATEALREEMRRKAGRNGVAAS